MIERLANIDIVISSTESPEAIIRARDFRDVLKRRMMEQLDQLVAEVLKRRTGYSSSAPATPAASRATLPNMNENGSILWSRFLFIRNSGQLSLPSRLYIMPHTDLLSS